MGRREVENPESYDAADVVPVAVMDPALVKRPVLSATAAEWRHWMVERGQPAYRARQVLDWVIRRRAGSFEPMSDLPRRCGRSSTPSGRPSARGSSITTSRPTTPTSSWSNAVTAGGSSAC